MSFKRHLIFGPHLIFGLCILPLAGGMALAQQDGWSGEEPEARSLSDAPPTASEALEDRGALSFTRNGQQYGWQVPPRPVDENSLNRPLTELERLSKSSSGVGFGSALYDAKSDNPLEPVAVRLRALDKITAQYTDLEIGIGEEAEYGTLKITPRTCDTRPPEEFPETTAFLEIVPTEKDHIVRTSASATAAAANEAGIVEETQEPAAGEMADAEGDPSTEEEGVNALFTGWMFASSPALNALEHPVYDVWVIGCKMVEPSQ